MTFKTALLISVLAMMFGLSVKAFAADPPVDPSAWNKDDPKYEEEERHRSNPENMNAAIVTPATCPTGVCAKNSPNTAGFDTTPLMVPTGDAAKDPTTTTSPVKK